LYSAIVFSRSVKIYQLLKEYIKLDIENFCYISVKYGSYDFVEYIKRCNPEINRWHRYSYLALINNDIKLFEYLCKRKVYFSFDILQKCCKNMASNSVKYILNNNIPEDVDTYKLSSSIIDIKTYNIIKNTYRLILDIIIKNIIYVGDYDWLNMLIGDFSNLDISNEHFNMALERHVSLEFIQKMLSINPNLTPKINQNNINYKSLSFLKWFYNKYPININFINFNKITNLDIYEYCLDLYNKKEIHVHIQDELSKCYYKFYHLPV
jgi:hypothetical protein